MRFRSGRTHDSSKMRDPSGSIVCSFRLPEVISRVYESRKISRLASGFGSVGDVCSIAKVCKVSIQTPASRSWNPRSRDLYSLSSRRWSKCNNKSIQLSYCRDCAGERACHCHRWSGSIHLFQAVSPSPIALFSNTPLWPTQAV
jgi:hypothetical protein